MLPDDERPVPSPPLAINVDPNKVVGFAKTVQTNVQGTITPTAPSVSSTLDHGIPFGQDNPSVALQAMLHTYGDCLQHMQQQLKNVAEYVDILVSAANQISANYRSSDQLAKASNEDIDTILKGAILETIAKQSEAPAGVLRGPRPE